MPEEWAVGRSPSDGRAFAAAAAEEEAEAVVAVVAEEAAMGAA